MSENNEKNLSTPLETSKSESALREERILEFWKENNIFEKSLEKDSPKGEFVFYEGPPTANGKPGIHHLEARAFKDVIPRYKTMCGYHVRRKAGWDTHGLPVELEVEKELGLKSKKEIEEFGIAEFNQRCKKSVWKYLDLWNIFTERIGFWLDQKDPYITYDKNYMESVWNVIKEIDKRKLLYKDYKVVPWCPRCGTGLSSHELAQGYEDVKDLSVYVKFKLKNEQNTFILAWTTTPWTLLGNVALAVGEKIDYVKIALGKEFLILAKARLSVIKGEYKIVEEMKGKDLEGLEYEPLYSYLSENISGAEKEKLNKAYKVYPASFVTTEDGTGVVHTAVMYGHDDFILGTEIGLPKFHLVGEDGNFLDFTGPFARKFVKDEKVAVDIIKDLAGRGILLEKEKYEHSYPHCWRCKTPLIYYARDSWYVKMSALRDELVAENKKINWEPEYIKEGRFGQWLEEIKDWAISRERYWGTPLPIWICDDCGERRIVGSVEDIKENVKKSGNKYYVMRHGEAENNVQNIYCSDKNKYHLTENGRTQVSETAKDLENKKITTIYCSPVLRTKETAEIVAKHIGFPLEKIIYDDRIGELEFGDFSGRSVSEFWDYMDGKDYGFDTKIPGGESHQDAKNRFGEFLYDIDKKHKGENILIISHGIAVELFPAVIEGADRDRSLDIIFSLLKNKPASLHREHDFVPLPHNENFELDLHKPYVDGIKLVCTHAGAGQACGGEMSRAKEVMDVWFDSGSMPFAQDHYPFSNKKISYPADFISEAIDQTRGWFYTLLAIGVLMGKGTPFKNVICLGHILDSEGKKMSKSIGNVVDPWTMIEKYGVDTLRLWMYSINQPGESKNFDEKTVLELHRQFFGLLYNVLAFYELYREKNLETKDKINSNNILDQWILARLDGLNKFCTDNLNSYRLLEPVRAIKEFIGDLSTWYLRRSRERIKNGEKDAKQTLYYVLKNLAKTMAPLAPFTAEDVWLKLKNKDDKESVNLEEWPVSNEVDPKILEKMGEVRKIVSLGLEARQKAGIKVRQPLSKIEVKNYKLSAEYSELIKDELNVKEISENSKIDGEVLLDAKITETLKEEGDYRELVRAVQDMRKKAGLTPSDVVSFVVETNDEGKKLIQKFEGDMKKTVLAEKIEFNENGGDEVKIDDLIFKIKLEK
ncbi:class I tRNA ligase family protein [Patescibacteria group bacterium]|nr:class I tRNA ligase family protein [Patescibacteria group bacterium]